MEFDGQELRAKTRNGADLILTPEKLDLIEEHLIEREGKESSFGNRKPT